MPAGEQIVHLEQRIAAGIIDLRAC